MKRLLQDCFHVDTLRVINEGTNKGPLKLRGVFGRADEFNNNDRRYPAKLLEREVKRLMPLAETGRLVGELDHPEYTSVKLSNASHKITSLTFDGNKVIGEATLLNTPAGKVAQQLIADGVQLGISSRGIGSLSELGEGTTPKYEVNDDYKCICFDLVADPSTRDAYPKIVEQLTEGRIQKLNKTKAQTLSENVFLKLLETKLNEKKTNPWAVCHASTGPKKNAKFERCVKDVKSKQGEEVEEGKTWHHGKGPESRGAHLKKGDSPGYGSRGSGRKISIWGKNTNERPVQSRAARAELSKKGKMKESFYDYAAETLADAFDWSSLSKNKQVKKPLTPLPKNSDILNKPSKLSKDISAAFKAAKASPGEKLRFNSVEAERKYAESKKQQEAWERPKRKVRNTGPSLGMEPEEFPEFMRNQQTKKEKMASDLLKLKKAGEEGRAADAKRKTNEGSGGLRKLERKQTAVAKKVVSNPRDQQSKTRFKEVRNQTTERRKRGDWRAMKKSNESVYKRAAKALFETYATAKGSCISWNKDKSEGAGYKGNYTGEVAGEEANWTPDQRGYLKDPTANADGTTGKYPHPFTPNKKHTKHG